MRSVDKTVRYEDRRSIGNDEVMRVRYGFNYIGGNKRPHFSVTADIFDKHGRDVGGGCCHDLIAEHFPEIAGLIRWHLVDDDGTPMHYIANGIYWMQKHLGIYRTFEHMDFEPSRPEDIVNFKSTIVFGAVTSDEVRLKQILDVNTHNECDSKFVESREETILKRVGDWLRSRRMKLAEAMKADIAQFPEIKYVTQNEINDTDQSSDLMRGTRG